MTNFASSGWKPQTDEYSCIYVLFKGGRSHPFFVRARFIQFKAHGTYCCYLGCTSKTTSAMAWREK